MLDLSKVPTHQTNLTVNSGEDDSDDLDELENSILARDANDCDITADVPFSKHGSIIRNSLNQVVRNENFVYRDNQTTELTMLEHTPVQMMSPLKQHTDGSDGENVINDEQEDFSKAFEARVS